MTTNVEKEEIDDSAVKSLAGRGDSSSLPASDDKTNDDRMNTMEKSFTDESNLDESDDFDDMESLLPNSRDVDSGNSSSRTKSKIESFNIDGESDDVDENSILRKSSTCCGLVKSTRTVGNMRILFPQYLQSSGWGVLGPHTLGPVFVWLLLLVATHGILGGINRHGLGMPSVVVAYLFLGVATYRLADVSGRDPGICLDQEIPGYETPERASQYRFCDRCKIWQPPDGVHCPQCNVCVAGYDHHCVWMGTCIGKRNYRQFVKFNVTWLLYCMYGFFWVLTIGPLVMKKY